jgi:hypothetical protein
MQKITITEGLSEINLIKKKVQDKHIKILGMLFQVSHLPDPFAQDGGSSKVIASEIQSVNDLYRKLAAIRAAISTANLTNVITIMDLTLSIHDWLIWKREISKSSIEFIERLCRDVKNHLDAAARSPQVYKDQDQVVQIVKTTINVDYPWCLKNLEQSKDILGKLDGQLSLKNATILIEV